MLSASIVCGRISTNCESRSAPHDVVSSIQLHCRFIHKKRGVRDKEHMFRDTCWFLFWLCVLNASGKTVKKTDLLCSMWSWASNHKQKRQKTFNKQRGNQMCQWAAHWSKSSHRRAAGMLPAVLSQSKWVQWNHLKRAWLAWESYFSYGK